MAWIKCIRLSFTLSVLLILVNGNAIRLGKTLNGIIKPSDIDAEDNSWLDDDTVMELSSYINLDDSSNLRLKYSKIYHGGNEHLHNQITSVHHFARHGLCRTSKGKVRFYTALKSKLCHTKSDFIEQIVDDLCVEKGRQLDNWCAELFDLNDDGNIDHFEEIFYDD